MNEFAKFKLLLDQNVEPALVAKLLKRAELNCATRHAGVTSKCGINFAAASAGLQAPGSQCFTA
ncbi:MAG: hypothetical protein EBS05_24890 [Proteobacteria bacterium]|nr:hypothetical protein [Pseudomonadota bacterium]